MKLYTSALNCAGKLFLESIWWLTTYYENVRLQNRCKGTDPQSTGSYRTIDKGNNCGEGLMHRNKHSMLGQSHLIILITLTLRLCEFTSATMHFSVADDASSSQILSWFLPVINTINLNTFKKEKDSNTLLECKFDTPLPCTTDLFLREEALDRDATCE